MKTTKLASVLGDHLELPSGQMLELDNPEFIRWLEASENRSFRFQYGFAGEHSFTARKEHSKKGQGDYWYGYRKVAGKLHKRYIGKTEDVTRLRLEEVAIALDTPAPERTKAESYINDYVTGVAAPTQPPGYINDYVTEVAAPTQPPSYINNYVTKEEFVEYQQRCREFEIQIEKAQQERDHFKALYQYTKQDYEGLANQGDLLHQCNREKQELQKQLYQLKGELETLQNESKQQIEPLKAEAEQLRAQLAALEQKNTKLINNLVESERLYSALKQNQGLPDYEAARDRYLATLRLGKQAPEYKRTRRVLEEFIDLLEQT